MANVFTVIAISKVRVGTTEFLYKVLERKRASMLYNILTRLTNSKKANTNPHTESDKRILTRDTGRMLQRKHYFLLTYSFVWGLS